jgi:gas vesicle protein
MGQESSNIRTQIEETRMRVGDEVEALSYKTDVPARVGDYVGEKKQAVTGKVADVKNVVSAATSTVLPSGEKVGRLKDMAERNPLGLTIGGVAVGFVAGLLLPSTRLENDKMGEMSDRVVDAAKETAGDAVESAKQVAHDTADSAEEQGRGLASTLQDKAEESLTGAPSAGGTEQ